MFPILKLYVGIETIENNWLPEINQPPNKIIETITIPQPELRTASIVKPDGPSTSGMYTEKFYNLYSFKKCFPF